MTGINIIFGLAASAAGLAAFIADNRHINQTRTKTMIHDILPPDENEPEARHALAALDWDGPTDSDGEPCFYVNHYECTDCDTHWTDQWSCGCDDECPKCGADLSPIESIDVTLADAEIALSWKVA